MRILHLEDNPRDAALIRDLLGIEMPEVSIRVVTTRDEFIAALEEGTYGAILSDFSLPGFNGKEALAFARKRRPETPFIFVSGAIGEDTAVECVRAGAADYLLKDRMQRLPLAIRRAVADAQERLGRRVAEDRIREQAELLDKVQDGIVVTDMENRIRYWNRGAERVLGWTAAEAVGKGVAQVLGPAFGLALSGTTSQPGAAEESRREISLSGKNGRTLMAEFRVAIVPGTDGATISRLSIITDISERKKLEEQLLRAQRLESLGMLAAGIAHDLNNALAPMLMAGGLLRTRVSDPADVRLVDLLEQSAGRGAALVKQIVSFAGGRTRDRMLLQTKHVLRDLMQLLHDTFPKFIRLEQEIAGDLWPVHGDPTQLHQVMLNLCINARDAMPEGGSLRIGARNEVITPGAARTRPGATPGRFVAIEIADSGTGIPPGILEQIWQPFFTTKSAEKGTGLGLSTVRGIVSSHGGFVTVDSEPGRGATFRVFLPAAPDDAPGATPESARRRIGGGRGEAVFVIDDQPSVRESIGVVLAQNGYRPLMMADGIEALSKFADRIGDVSLVITDLDMPGLDGVALSQAVLHLNPAAQILLISGTTDARVERRLGEVTGAAFLAKPFSPDALLSTVERLLDSGRRTPAGSVGR